MVQETFDVEFGETNGSQGASDNLDDVGGEPLRDAMKNMSLGDIKSKEDDDVQIIEPPSTSLVPQDEDKDVRDAHEDTQVTHEQAVAQAQDVDAPKQPLKWRQEDHHTSSKITLKTSSSGVHHVV